MRELAATVSRLKRQLGVRDELIRTVTDIVGIELKGKSNAQFLVELEKRVREAARLAARVKELEALVATLTDAAARASGQALVAQANLAISEGRLDDADAALRTLSNLRWEQSANAERALDDVTTMRVDLALLRYDEDGALRAVEEMDAAKASLRRASDWTSAMLRARILRTKGERRGDKSLLVSAAEIYRLKALPLAPKDQHPIDWGKTQIELGRTLFVLGDRYRDTALLEDAAVAYKDALTVFPRASEPESWATANNNLGNVLVRLGEYQRKRERFDEAIRVFGLALEVRQRATAPADWATTQSNLGNANLKLAELTERPEPAKAAIPAFRAALEVWTVSDFPDRWALANDNLGNALRVVGEHEKSEALVAEAIAAYDTALTVRVRDAYPVDWAGSTYNRAVAQAAMFEITGDRSRLELSMADVKAALAVFEELKMDHLVNICRQVIAYLEGKLAEARPAS